MLKSDVFDNYNNARNHILACFKVCSSCKCFFNVPNARLGFNQLCLKNQIINVLNMIRSLSEKEFDDFFINNLKVFKVNCFVSKGKEGLKL
jgi:hypothetical protein